MAITVVEIRATDKTAPIERCSEMLPNQMQCYRGADYVYTNDVVEAGKPPRQVCRYHAKYLIELERQRLQDAQNATANPEPPKVELTENKTEPNKTENEVNVNTPVNPDASSAKA